MIIQEFLFLVYPKYVYFATPMFNNLNVSCTRHTITANTAIMAAFLSFLLVSLLSVWQVEVLSILEGGGAVFVTYSCRITAHIYSSK